MIFIELTNRFGGRSVQFEQIVAQREAGGHLAESALVGIETGGVERGDGSKYLGARFDAQPGIRGVSRLLSSRIAWVKEKSCAGTENGENDQWQKLATILGETSDKQNL